MRIAKYIAAAGICSRRRAEELVRQADVLVNDERVDVTYDVCEGDIVTYKGESVEPEEYVYVLLNKPKGYITTARDERGRATVLDLINLKKKARLYPVGRLDRATTGLLLLTNDGHLAQKLAHPRYAITKKYRVTLDRPLDSQGLRRLKSGVTLEDGLVKPDYVALKSDDRTVFVIELHSGKNRVIRRLCKALGYTVKKLDRYYYAGLTKTGLAVGAWRVLKKNEIAALKQSVTRKL